MPHEHFYTICLTILLLAFSLLIDPPALQGQDAPAFEVALPDSIVVSATRQATDHRKTGRRISVWTAADIEQLPVSSYDELLRTVAGVDVNSRGAFGVQSDITIRGSTFNGVLVLLDGARLNDPMTGHFLADLPVPLSEIARVEVVRGPNSAIYGPDALGGVIHLITHGALASAGDHARFTALDLDAAMGSHGLFSGDLNVRHVTGSRTLGLASTWQRSDGTPVHDSDGQPIAGSKGPVRTDFDRRAHTLSYATRLSGTRLHARAGMDSRDFSAFHFYTPFPSDTAREATSTYWLQARLDGVLSRRADWHISVAARQHEDEYQYNPQVTSNIHTSCLLTSQAYVTVRPRRDVVTIIGLSAEGRSITSNNMGEHSDAAGGVFATLMWEPAAHLTATSGARVDYDAAYGIELTPQLSLAYNLPAATFRVHGGRAVRAPNYVERYFNTAVPVPRDGNLGNPELEPESAWSLEAGIDMYATETLSLHATGFTRTTGNLIDYVLAPPRDTVFFAGNVHRVDTRGIEVEAEHRGRIGNFNSRSSLSYTLMYASLGEHPPDVEYKYALTNARSLTQGRLTVSHGRLAVSSRTLLKNPIAGEAYNIWDFRASWTVHVGGFRASITGEVRNAFDAHYMEVFNAPMPGRNWLAGVRLAR